jgi:hypothetical protein
MLFILRMCILITVNFDIIHFDAIHFNVIYFDMFSFGVTLQPPKERIQLYNVCYDNTTAAAASEQAKNCCTVS